MTLFGRRGSTRMVRTAAVITAAVAMLGAAGCTGDNGAQDRKDGSKAGNGKMMSFDLAAKDSSAVQVNVPDKPIATTPSSTEGLVFELYTVKRSDKVVTVVFALHNTSDKEIENRASTKDLDEDPTALANDASNVSLVDTTGLKEYRSFLTGDDADGNCLCSTVWNISGENDFSADERQHYVTQIAAPPAEVKQVNVLAHVATVPDVKIDG